MDRFKEYLEREVLLTDDEWEVIQPHIRIIHLPKSSFFIKNGEMLRREGFLLEGVMRYYEIDEEGNDPTCYFTYETHYLTDPYTRNTGKVSQMNLQAITPCTIAEISLEAQKNISQVLPRWNDIVTALIMKVSVEFADSKSLISLNATDRYSRFVALYPNLVLRVPLQYIASYLGIAQPSLSRLRKNVKHSGT